MWLQQSREHGSYIRRLNCNQSPPFSKSNHVVLLVFFTHSSKLGRNTLSRFEHYVRVIGVVLEAMVLN